MPSAFRVALVGLAPGERSLVEAAFSLPGPDGARHEMVHDPARANLIILDAEDTRAVHHFRARGLAAPVLLIGQDDAHTGWPAIPRPIERHALLGEAARLLSGAPADLEAPPLAPAFQATVPFAPLEMQRLRGAADGFDETRSFQETRPFERPARGAPEPRRAGAARPVVHESIDARSVLLWRDAKDGALVSSVAALPPAPPAPVAGARAEAASQAPRLEAPDARLPAIAGFESTRDGDPVAHQGVPANWRELARQRDEERRQRVTPADAEAFSSSFADPSDHPTSPPGQAYGYAFLDDRSLGRQTRAVCRALRRRARALGQTLNIVVMARDEGPLRRLLARWAGCDTWMTLPLERKRLAQHLLGGSRSAG